MKRIRLPIAVKLEGKEQWFTIDAYEVAPGLAIHRHWLPPTPDEVGTIAKDLYGKAWVITHIPTGRCVVQSFKSRQKAIHAVNLIRELADWTLPDETSLTRDPDLTHKVYKAVAGGM